MNQTTPFQCFRKHAPEAAAASGDTLQTDGRNLNIIETTENEPDKADTILRSTENEADYIVTLGVCVVINLTVTSRDCWHIRTISDLKKLNNNI